MPNNIGLSALVKTILGKPVRSVKKDFGSLLSSKKMFDELAVFQYILFFTKQKFDVRGTVACGGLSFTEFLCYRTLIFFFFF